MKLTSGVYTYYKDLPTWAKGVVIIGGIGITWFGIVNPIRKLIIKKIDQSKFAKSAKEFNDDLKKLKQSGVNPTYTDAQYKSWADKIETAFSGCDWQEAIFEVNVPIVGSYSGSGATLYNIIYKLKNNADFAKLVTAFGSRTYDQCGPRIFGISGDITANLFKAVEDELNQSEIIGINKLLTGKKITYQF